MSFVGLQGACGLSSLCLRLPPLPEGGFRIARRLFSAEEFHKPGGAGTEARQQKVSGVTGFLSLCPGSAPDSDSSCRGGLGQGDYGISPH